jgi:hypothetical protein
MAPIGVPNRQKRVELSAPLSFPCFGGLISIGDRPMVRRLPEPLSGIRLIHPDNPRSRPLRSEPAFRQRTDDHTRQNRPQQYPCHKAGSTNLPPPSDPQLDRLS